MEDAFKTSDLIEAAYLSFLGFPYEIDRRNPRRVFFLFPHDKLLVMKLRDLNDNVPPYYRKFAVCLREMKRSVISEETKQ
jgi:hypothetical protein